MSVYEESLHVDLTAEADGVVQGANVSEAAMQKLTAAVGELTAQFKVASASGDATEKSIAATGAAAEGAAAKVKVAKDSTEGLAAAAEAAEGQMGVLARGLNSLGLESEGMAARLEAAAGALGKIGGALPELLAIGAAITAISAAFAFFKDGIDGAVKMQQTMESLRASVQAQGGAWKEASEQIEHFLDVESIASGFARNDLASALQEIVAAGAPAADAMHMVSVAEEMSIGTGRSLKEIVDALVIAEGTGRVRALEQLDLSLRKNISSGMNYAQLVDALHEKYGKQIDDANGVAATNERARASWDKLSETVGDSWTPTLQYLGEVMIGAAKVAGEFGKSIGTGMHGAAFVFVDSVMAMVHGAEALGDVLKGDFKSASAQGAESLKSLAGAAKDLKDATIGWMPSFGQGLGDLFHMHAIGNDAIWSAVHAHDTAKYPPITFNPTLEGSPKHKKAKSYGTFTYDDTTEHLREAKSDAESLDTAIAHLPKTVEGYTEALRLLNQELQVEHQQQSALRDELAVAKMALDEASNAYQNYQAKFKPGQKLTEAQEEALRSLKQTLHDTQAAYDAVAGALDTVNGHIAKTNATIDQDTQELQQKQQQAYDKIAQSISTLADQGVKLFDSLFNHGKSGAQSFGQVVKSMIDDIIAYIEKSALTSVLMRAFGIASVGPGGQSGIAGPGGWLGALGLAGSFGGAMAPASANTYNPAAAWAAGQMVGGGVMPSTPSVGGGLGNLRELLFGGGGGAAGGGAFAGGAINLDPDGVIAASGVGGRGGVLGNLFGAGGGINWGGHIMGAGNATWGSLGLAGVGGAMLGQTLFGGRGFADIGGATGGMAGLLIGSKIGAIGGPLGALAGAILGAAAGSLFGNHFNPADEPDIYHTQEWGQELADLQGKTSGDPMNANGQQFVMDSATQQATNGKGWNILMEHFVQQFRGKEDELPASLQAAFPQIAALWGGATNQADFNGDGKDGNLDIGGGQRANYATFWGMITQYGSAVSQLMSNYQATPSYSAAISGQVAPIATYTPSGSPAILHAFPDTGAPAGYAGGGGGGGGTAPGGGAPPAAPGPVGPGGQPRGTPGALPQTGGTIINVTQNVGGTVVSQATLDDHIYSVVGIRASRGAAAISGMKR